MDTSDDIKAQTTTSSYSFFVAKYYKEILFSEKELIIYNLLYLICVNLDQQIYTSTIVPFRK